MTDTTLPTLSDLQHDAVMLGGLIEALDVLNTSTSAMDTAQDIIERRAANGMQPVIEAAIRSANDLADKIEALSDAERKAGAAK